MTFGIVGAETLLGRELREQLKQAGLGKTLQFIGAQDEISGILSEEDGEPVIMTPLDEERLKQSDLVFLAGTPESSRKAHTLLKGKGGPVLIDLTHEFESLPSSRLHSLLPENVGRSGIQVVAHPAAAALALIFSRLENAERAVVQIFEPASERGQLGLNELQQQSSGLLAFQTLNKKVFDAQLGFNLLPRYGEDSPERLEDVEARIDKHLVTLLGTKATLRPSLRVTQAPVFHGYCFSIWVEFKTPANPKRIAEDLASAHLEVRPSDLEPPTNVGATGQPGVTVGLIESDRHNSRAVWLWAAADNFRLRVDTAIAIAKGLQG